MPFSTQYITSNQELPIKVDPRLETLLWLLSFHIGRYVLYNSGLFSALRRLHIDTTFLPPLSRPLQLESISINACSMRSPRCQSHKSNIKTPIHPVAYPILSLETRLSPGGTLSLLLRPNDSTDLATFLWGSCSDDTIRIGGQRTSQPY